MRTKAFFYVAQFILKILSNFNIVILRKNVYDEIIDQRNKVLLEIISIERQKLSKGLEGVVFSKDRPLQLYTLLETYNNLVENPVKLTVIYKASTKKYDEAYKKVFSLLRGGKTKFSFVKESQSFKVTLNSILRRIKIKNIFFLVDDIIFIRKIDLSLAASLDTKQYILSLRHSPHLKRSYTSNMEQKPPKLNYSKNFIDMKEFRWFAEKNEWSNPYSVDGHILSLAEIYAISKFSSYSGPNSFEYVISSFNALCISKQGLCYNESKILNLPINRVQNESKNTSGFISTNYLLKKWNENMSIDTSIFNNYIPHATHEEHPIKFKKLK
jgi:hypothetical protein